MGTDPMPPPAEGDDEEEGEDSDDDDYDTALRKFLAAKEYTQRGVYGPDEGTSMPSASTWLSGSGNRR